MPRAFGNYSLEAIFADVRNRLQPWVDIEVRVAPCLSNGLMRRLWILLEAARLRSDIIHITGDINFAALLVPKRKCVLTILDCIGADTKSGLSGWLYRALWFRWPVHRSSVVTTISHSSKRDIVRITGCAPEKVVVIGVAISTNYTRVDSAFNSECPRILQVGAAPNKNIERLAAALESVPCKLVVVGQMNQSQLESLQRHRIDTEHHLTLTPSQIIEQYVRADIVSFASTFEGFGMPIIEANAVGRPVLTGNVTSMPEVAGDAACIVDPFDTASLRAGILRIIHDTAYRAQLITNGFKNARRFDPDVIASLYLGVYHTVAGSAK